MILILGALMQYNSCGSVLWLIASPTFVYSLSTTSGADSSKYISIYFYLLYNSRAYIAMYYKLIVTEISGQSTFVIYICARYVKPLYMCS